MADKNDSYVMRELQKAHAESSQNGNTEDAAAYEFLMGFWGNILENGVPDDEQTKDIASV